MLRSILLRASESRWLARRVPELPFARRAVRRFMPGERPEDALAAAGALAERGFGSVLTCLGENVTTPADADAVAEHYRGVLEDARAGGLDIDLSVKPTHLGLDLDSAATIGRVVDLARAADAADSFLWVDMEAARYVDDTLEAFRAARAEVASVGVCLQANLRRTAGDLEALLPLAPSIRLVKGAYRESRDTAWQGRHDVDAAYRRLAGLLLGSDVGRVVFGTHDAELLEDVAGIARAVGLMRGAYEVHMLYGIRQELAEALRNDGHPVRILISYGDAWFPWYVRRLAERPANLLLLARSVIG